MVNPNDLYRHYCESDLTREPIHLPRKELRLLRNTQTESQILKISIFGDFLMPESRMLPVDLPKFKVSKLDKSISQQSRNMFLEPFLYTYNWHRPHRGINGLSPVCRLEKDR